MFKIFKDSPIPLHVQLLNELRHAILRGELKPHERLPGEYTLVSQLNISRSTIQRAWQTALDENLIYRIPAKGTFVAELTNTVAKRRIIGCIMPEFRYTFDGNLFDGAEEILRRAGYRLLFAQSERRIAEENRLIRAMCEEGAAGILLWPVGEYMQDRYVYHPECSLPIVLLDRPILGSNLPCVASQNYDGTRQAMEHLLSLGHQRIAFAAWPPLDLLPIAERGRAYHDAMRDAGLSPLPFITLGAPVEAINYRRYTQEAHEDVTYLAEVLSQPDRPTAIFAMNDIVATLVLRAAKEIGLKVPDDLSLVGFDNHTELAERSVPSLTTIAQDTRLLAREAARRLLILIEGEPALNTFILIPTRLVVRNSTNAPPGRYEKRDSSPAQAVP